MTGNILHHVDNAFLFDHNMIVEEFGFYQSLTPKDQTRLTNFIFKDFIKTFIAFFEPCENGFKSEFLIQMYHRSYNHGTEVIFYQQKVEELCFVTRGCVNLSTNDGVKFMALPMKAVFGDYAILHDLRSNISFRTTE